MKIKLLTILTFIYLKCSSQVRVDTLHVDTLKHKNWIAIVHTISIRSKFDELVILDTTRMWKVLYKGKEYFVSF